MVKNAINKIIRAQHLFGQGDSTLSQHRLTLDGGAVQSQPTKAEDLKKVLSSRTGRITHKNYVLSIIASGGQVDEMLMIWSILP